MADANIYTFGDNDLAAERLRILARAFDPTSRAFLTEVRRRTNEGRRGDEILPLAHAVDLGCGPGYTTRMLREILAARVTTGIDRSPRFLARAQLSHTTDLRFLEHDVTVAPFPVGDADFLFARFLLTHLREPAAALQAWATLAAPGGHLVLEETALMSSSQPALQRYYGLVAALQREHGQDMTVGQSLERLATGSGWIVEESRLVPARLPARPMARIHAMNLRTWKTDRFAGRVCDADTLEDLEISLERLACGNDTALPVECQLKQVWLTRAPVAAAPLPPGAAAKSDARPGG